MLFVMRASLPPCNVITCDVSAEALCPDAHLRRTLALKQKGALGKTSRQHSSRACSA